MHFSKLVNHSCRWFLQNFHSHKNHLKKQGKFCEGGKCHVALTLMQFCIHFTAGCGPRVEEANMQKLQVAKWTKNSPGVSLIQAFYFKLRGGFFFHFFHFFFFFCWQTKGEAEAVCSSVKDGGLGGGALWFFPSTAGSHYGHHLFSLLFKNLQKLEPFTNNIAFLWNIVLSVRWQ